MNRIFAVGFLAAAYATAQPTIAPTEEQVGPRRGQDLDGYNVTNSFEVGYRWRDVDGNLGKYRSDVNFGNGVRLLGSTLSIHSKEGHGRYFDELLLNTQGLGNDPYQFSSFRIQKNKIYRYDLLWRENAYYNPALPIAGGEHFLDTSRKLQDHQIVLLPQSRFRIFAGYSRNSQTGPALSTINLFDQHRGDEFPVFTDIRRLQDEYRLGAEVSFWGLKLSAQRGWEHFRDDTRNTSGLLTGNNTTDATQLTSFRRDEPYHGSTGNWRVHLLTEHAKWYSLNGRFTYAGTRRNFIFDEAALGTDRSRRRSQPPGLSLRQWQAACFGGEPHGNAESSRCFNYHQPHCVSPHSNGRRWNIYGGQQCHRVWSAHPLPVPRHTDDHQLDGYELPRVSNAGLLRGISILQPPDPFNRATQLRRPDSRSCRRRAGQHAARRSFWSALRPIKPLTFIADAEIGRADRPIYPTSEKNYHALGGRIQYRTRTLTFGGLVRTNYNFNSHLCSRIALDRATIQPTSPGPRSHGSVSMHRTASSISTR